MDMFTSYGHIIKLNVDFSPGHAPLTTHDIFIHSEVASQGE